MKIRALVHTKKAVAVLLGAGLVGGGVAVRDSLGSDHQDTAITELNPQVDITDVWAFPGSSDDRIVLAMTLASPIVGSSTLTGQPANFDPNALYQLKVDNNQDGVEDLVFQFSFDQLANGSQTVDVIGPVAPRDVGAFGNGVRDAFSTATPAIRRGAVNSTLTANLAANGAAQAGTMQVFAGLRDDPFYIDLEQFFRIIPDRRPTQGPLSQIGGVIPPPPGTVAAAWRPKCTNGTPNAGQTQYDQTRGCAVDFLRGFNALAIVVELPETQVTQGRGNGQVGIWATVSQ
ncbi:MAG: DUF4331 family protein [Gemmatimonadetes bacterium]|nr:DUF4331 family protein [Gemmatimonadota bacterium]